MRLRPLPHLYGVAVDGLTTAADLHDLGDLQDVVWHVAAGAAAVANLPPLLPVIQDLSERTAALGAPPTGGGWRGGPGLTSTTSSFNTDSSVLFLATKSYLDLAKSCDWPRLAPKPLEGQERSAKVKEGQRRSQIRKHPTNIRSPACLLHHPVELVNQKRQKGAEFRKTRGHMTSFLPVSAAADGLPERRHGGGVLVQVSQGGVGGGVAISGRGNL